MKTFIRRSLLEQASTHLRNNEYADANKIYSEILTTKPLDTEALFGVGIIAQKLKSVNLALSFFSKVVEVDNNHGEALLQRGKVHFLAKNFEQAIADFSATLRINPNNVDALNNRGIANAQLSNFSRAKQDFGQAIQICSSNADLFYNRALANWNLKNYEDAITDYTAAIELRPDYYQAYNNRGTAYRELANFRKALSDFETSTTLNNNFADGYWNQSLIHLMNSEYEKAWPLYEYRWKSKRFPSAKRNFNFPLWLGDESIDKKTILIHSEQGLGDTIQFCRYIKLLNQRKCDVFIEVEKPLLSIMRCLLPQKNIFQKGHALPKFDFHCPMMSLPYVFNTNVNSVPFSTPYLTATKDRIAWWRTHLGFDGKPRLGLSWRGNPNHPNDKKRSIELRDLIESLSSKFSWFSLQFDINEEESKLIGQSQQIRHFGNLIGDFAETAAFCKNLDAIICVDTSIAHLAGAIGSTTYLLLAEVADSRWHATGKTSPWYNSITILRKDAQKDYRALLVQAQNMILNDKAFKTVQQSI